MLSTLACLDPYEVFAEYGWKSREKRPGRKLVPEDIRDLVRTMSNERDAIFGRINGLNMHRDGRLYLPDNRLCRMVVLSAAGEHPGNISRKGDWAGKLRQPVGLVFLASDVLGVGMRFPAKLVTLRAGGTPIGTRYLVGSPAKGNVAVLISQCVDDVPAANRWVPTYFNKELLQ